MSTRQITIAIDAMGGDDSPYKSLKGAEIFAKKHPVSMMSPEFPIFLTVNHNKKSPGTPLFKSMPLGVNKLSTMMKRIDQKLSWWVNSQITV